MQATFSALPVSAPATATDRIEAIRARRIITCPRGSWRWQDAFRVAEYAPRQTKDGRWVWENVGYLTQKASAPQLRRWTSYGDLPHGGLHNRPVDAALLAAN